MTTTARAVNVVKTSVSLMLAPGLLQLKIDILLVIDIMRRVGPLHFSGRGHRANPSNRALNRRPPFPCFPGRPDLSHLTNYRRPGEKESS